MTDQSDPPKKAKPAPRRHARGPAASKTKPKSTPAATHGADAQSARSRVGAAVKRHAQPGGRGRTVAGVVGGIGAAGAIIAGVIFARRRATSKDQPLAGAKAHQADGTSSSAELAAGIADEGMVPDRLP